MLVTGNGLHGDGNWVREHGGTDTPNNKGTNDTILHTFTTSEVVKETKGKEPTRNTGDDKWFHSLDVVDDDGKDWRPNDRGERTDGGDSCGRGNRLVHGNNKDCVEIVVGHVVDEVEQEGETNSSPDTTILDQLGWSNWILGELRLEEDEYWNKNNTKNKRTNDLTRVPLRLVTTGKGEWGQDTTQEGDHEDDTGDIKSVEELNEGGKETMLLVVSLTLLNLCPLWGLTSQVPHMDQAADEWEGGKWEDESPHTDTPLPVAGTNSRCDVTGDPSVDNEWQSWDELVE